MSIVLKSENVKLLEPCAGIILPLILISVVFGERKKISSFLRPPASFPYICPSTFFSSLVSNSFPIYFQSVRHKN